MPAAERLALLLCGSFNPVTHMHLRMFELARDALTSTGLYQVIAGILSPVSDHYGKAGLISSSHRLEMARRAARSSTWIKCDDWEASRSEWSTTVKVLRHHRARLRTALRDDNIQVKLLCGADVLQSFEQPGVWTENDREEILRDFGVVCISRGGFNIDTFIYESDQLTRNRHHIRLVTEWVSNEISATKIRRAIRRGESVKYLIQDDVIEYIQQNGLYGMAPTPADILNANAGEPDLSCNSSNQNNHVQAQETTQGGTDLTNEASTSQTQHNDGPSVETETPVQVQRSRQRKSEESSSDVPAKRPRTSRSGPE